MFSYYGLITEVKDFYRCAILFSKCFTSICYIAYYRVYDIAMQSFQFGEQHVNFFIQSNNTYLRYLPKCKLLYLARCPSL